MVIVNATLYHSNNRIHLPRSSSSSDEKVQYVQATQVDRFSFLYENVVLGCCSDLKISY